MPELENHQVSGAGRVAAVAILDLARLAFQMTIEKKSNFRGSVRDEISDEPFQRDTTRDHNIQDTRSSRWYFTDAAYPHTEPYAGRFPFD